MSGGPAAETMDELREVLKKEVLETMKDEIRDARGLMKDLKQTIKEGREVVTTLVKDEIEAHIRAEVKKELDRMSEEVENAMQLSVDKIHREFDKLSNLLLGLNAKHRKKGQPSMEEIVKRCVNDALEAEVMLRAKDDPRFARRVEKELSQAFKDWVDREGKA